MVTAKADGLLYFQGSHLSSTLQLTVSKQAFFGAREIIKASGAGGRQAEREAGRR